MLGYPKEAVIESNIDDFMYWNVQDRVWCASKFTMLPRGDHFIIHSTCVLRSLLIPMVCMLIFNKVSSFLVAHVDPILRSLLKAPRLALHYMCFYDLAFLLQDLPVVKGKKFQQAVNSNVISWTSKPYNIQVDSCGLWVVARIYSLPRGLLYG